MAQILSKRDIVGFKISNIWQLLVWNPGDIDTADHVFELENGNRFRLPWNRNEEIEAATIPLESNQLDIPEMETIRSSAILDILSPKDEELASDSEACILLESGVWITQSTHAPHGTADVGLYTNPEFASRIVELSELTSIFD